MVDQKACKAVFDQENSLRQKVLLFAIAVAVFYGVWFGILAFLNGNNILAMVDLAMVVLFVFAGIIAVKIPESPTPAHIIATSTVFFFLYLFVTGGVAGIGPLWSFILPLIVFFLTGFYGGIVISTLYLALCVGVFFYNQYFPGLFYEHSRIFIDRFFGIFLLSAVVSGAYEYQKRRNESLLRNLLNEIDKAKTRAEAANEAKTSFLAMVSHEIRTPINGINGLIEILKDTQLDEKQFQYVSMMRNSCDDLMGIIRDILDLSRIESGKIHLETENFSLKKTIEEIAGVLQSKADSKKIDIFTELQEGLPDQIIGDQLRLKQVIGNLLDNAIKFTHQGRIELKVSQVDSEKDGSELLFEVIDTGIGIDEETQSRLFEEFEQAHSSTTRLYGGSGLGLAISRRLTKLMNGKIGVESQPNRGSRFYFRIPLKQSQ
jgi:signal transduction histidine kinase